MDELLAQFTIEAHDLIQRASDDLLALERSPRDVQRLENLFRAVHTLKGSVALFDFAPLHQVLHRAEDLLVAARNGSVEVDADLIDPLIAVVEWIDKCVVEIERTEALSSVLAARSAAILAAMQDEPGASDEVGFVDANQPIPKWATDLLNDFGLEQSGRPLVAIRYEPHAECFFNGDDPLATMARVPNLLHLRIAPRESWPRPEDYDPFRCNLLIEGVAEATLADIHSIFRLIPDQTRLIDVTNFSEPVVEQPPVGVTDRHAGTIRVDTARLDALVEIAGELITAKNGLLPLAKDVLHESGSERLFRRVVDSHQDIERLVGSLYSAVTRARMIPLGHTFRRFPRLVRETAARLGKSVDLVVEGATVEADRDIVEDLFEPLLHLVRNALDHGIEAETERLKAGKPARGTLTLRASQKSEQIEVELVDDGRGIDPAEILHAAISKQMLTADAASALSEDAMLQLLFAPGFSTADKVSDLSGRGVGMDAVKAAILRLGGRTELTSAIGGGTAVRLNLPVSFAMSRLMVVEAGGERYGISMDSVLESVKLRRAEVMPVRSGLAFVLRSKTLPLLFLRDLLKLPHVEQQADLNVLIAQVRGERIGIAVDGIAERAETLMRPLSGLLQGLPGVAGTTLLGDGRVLVVLDLEDLIE
ncbi:MAG: hypothetical protein JWM58_2504 [Rhizobium sp.]|nr:hypothetical protein [Rhizobium sp.]